MNLIDSSVLIAYFRIEETNHEKAQEILGKLKSIVISDYILLEVSTVLLLRENKDISNKAVDILTKNRDISIIRLTDSELKETIESFQKQKNKLSFVDISLLILSKKREMILHSFDKNLQKEISEP